MRVCVVFVMEDQALTAGHVDTTRRSAVRGAGLLAVGLLLAALGACREEEQGRELHFQKGTYKGQADTPLGEEAANNLRRRASHQRAP